MSSHKVPFDLHGAAEATDPGNAGSIVVNRSPYLLGLVSAGAETRTLARPTRVGAIAFLYMKTDGGDITLTVTGNLNEAGTSTFTFSDPGQFILLMSAYESSGGTYYWRKIADYATGNVSPAEAGSLVGITATAGEINNVADASARVSTLTAAGLVLTAADTGKTYFIDNATGFVAATLPLASTAAGVNFTFINKTANTSGNHTIVTSASENVLKGNQNDVGGAAGDNGTADDTISFVANQSVAGDKVELFCDGTSWFAYAISRVAAGMTFTQASA